MSPHKAEARLIGTILAIAAASCLASAVGGLAAAATRGDWIMVAALTLATIAGLCALALHPALYPSDATDTGEK